MRSLPLLVLAAALVAGCDSVTPPDGTPAATPEVAAADPESAKCSGANATSPPVVMSGTPSKSDGVTNSDISEAFGCGGAVYWATSDTAWDGSLFVGARTTIDVTLTRDNGQTESYSDMQEFYDRNFEDTSARRVTVSTETLGGFGCQFMPGYYWPIPGSCVAELDVTATHEYFMAELSSTPYVVTTDLHREYDNSGLYY